MNDAEDQPEGMSRRKVLGGAGLAVAGGVAMAAAGGATVAVADAAAATTTTPVGVGPSGTTTVEFRSRITQSSSASGLGDQFVSYGYLYKATNAKQSDLFAGVPSESTALLTAYATGQLTNRVLDTSVHVLDIVGTLTVYQRSTAGASWADPSSFAVGTAVASFKLALQDVLAVFAPAKGLPTLSGDMRQTTAAALGGGLAGRTFGHPGLRLRFLGTGLGTLVDPVTLNAQLELGGNWSAV